MDFTKMHGLGNDFLVVDGPIDLEPHQVAILCDRRLGVGADGVLVVSRVDETSVRMRYYNADGGIAEMCGNGIRCVARYAVDRGLVDDRSFSVHTDAGNVPVTLMGGDRVKTYLARSTCGSTLELDGLDLQAVDMGNPHVVTFVDDLESAPVASAGPEIETHPTFPDKTNVEFVRIDANDRISVRTWERGVGETQACGTGAGAAVVAAHQYGLVGTEVDVRLLGGELSIRLDGDDVWQEGPAEYVFSGSTTLLDGDRQPDLLEA